MTIRQHSNSEPSMSADSFSNISALETTILACWPLRWMIVSRGEGFGGAIRSPPSKPRPAAIFKITTIDGVICRFSIFWIVLGATPLRRPSSTSVRCFFSRPFLILSLICESLVSIRSEDIPQSPSWPEEHYLRHHSVRLPYRLSHQKTYATRRGPFIYLALLQIAAP